MTGVNILLVWDRLGDYHRARVTALQTLTTGTVFQADLGAADGLYKWDSSQSPHAFQLSDKPVEQPDFGNRLRAFLRIVKEQRIGIVGIAGYGRKEYVAMMAMARLQGIKVVMFAESWYPGSPLADAAKGLMIDNLTDGVLVSGLRAQHHFHHRLKLPLHKLATHYSVVDNAHFAGTARHEANVLLCVARFAPEKNLINLVSAFNNSQLPAAGWVLKLVGGGPQQAELQALAGPAVQLHNWLGYGQLPQLYQSASAFILPSQFEPWGLVVNEAMAAGLPVIVSQPCGCAPDLAPGANEAAPFPQQVSNGWWCGTSREDITAVLNELAAASAEQLQGMGAASHQIIAGYSPLEWSRRFLTLAGESV